MLPHIVNIIAGFVLSSSKLKEFGGKDFFEKIEGFLKPYHTIIGWVTLIVGVLTLLDRIGIISTFNGDSYPQAIPAILVGLILLSDYFEKYPQVHGLITKINPYRMWIGLWAISAGLISILFGCIVC